MKTGKFYIVTHSGFRRDPVLHIHRSNLPNAHKRAGVSSICGRLKGYQLPTDEQVVMGKECDECTSILGAAEKQDATRSHLRSVIK